MQKMPRVLISDGAFTAKTKHAGASIRRIAFAIAACVLGCVSCVAGAQPAFPLHTTGRFIVDSNGARVRLNGVNWYGTESTDYVVAGLQVATLSSIVQQIKSLGFNVVRLPWSNQFYESNPVVQNYALAANPAMEGEHALTILDQVISALTGQGIMVILDNHNSNAEWCCSTSDGNSLWYNSDYPQSNWIADWQGMVQRYAANPLVIGIDLRNEPRSPATWGGSAATDWHAAAELGGNAVLGVNPHLLIFVEGIDYALDLSGAQSLPVQLNLPNQLVYEAHNYAFDYSNLSGYSDYMSRITPKWAYLVTGSNPQPLWIGEFGTCNTADTCIDSNSSADGGYWFNMLTAFIQQYGLDWTYWPLNGTHSTGGSSAYGSVETYGILNSAWSEISNSALRSRMQSIMSSAPPGISLVGNSATITIAPGATGAATVTIVPGNGFTGTVNLTCSVSGPSGAATAVPQLPYPGATEAKWLFHQEKATLKFVRNLATSTAEPLNLPTCSVPPSQNLPNANTVNIVVSISTTAQMARGAAAGHSISAGSTGAIFACLLVLAFGFGRRNRILLPMLLVIAIAWPCLACGGGSGGSSNPGTAAGTYTIVVNASGAGGASSSVKIAVNVQ